MPKLKLTAGSSIGALSSLCSLLFACTGVMSGTPGGDGATPGGPGPLQPGGGGGTTTVGGGGTTSTASSKPEVGVMTIRRLNRTQYTNTLGVLTGTKTDPGAKFPADDLSFGFDNIGEALTVQPLHIELFEQSADAVLTELFALPATDANRTKVLGCDAQTGGHACVVSTVSAFAERAFRRPVTEAEITPFVSIADSFTMTGGKAADGLKLALKGVLLSPHFLFRVELDPSPTSKDVHRLNAYELATRLSYYLWSTMPDAALFASAKSGALTTDAGLVTEVSRMLADPKAQALTSDFAGQWLNIRRVGAVKPDAGTYPTFSAQLAADMETESYMMFTELLATSRPITDVLNSDFTYVNKALATFYGMTPPPGDGFVKVPLAGSHRTGFLMQASFLTLTSNPTRTSPVKRGKWVLEQLLCSPPPPPPPGVKFDLDANAGGQSVRARLEAHRAKEPCHTCHALMDPIGLSFENFDGVGAYRTADQYGPIDATGTLQTAAGEVTFNGAEQLLPLVSKDERLAPCVAEKVLTYAVGRGFTTDDAIALKNVLTATNTSGQGLRGLVGSVAMSESFKSRRAVGE
jgi:Protein of unknown function (DUF1592)/Protein of unknown function (DUF1588)/Protein of unknown function (DUF1595)/Protein of unknown function (DUF1587)/Protein of unknown function (DUF1585)